MRGIYKTMGESNVRYDVVRRLEGGYVKLTLLSQKIDLLRQAEKHRDCGSADDRWAIRRVLAQLGTVWRNFLDTVKIANL